MRAGALDKRVTIRKPVQTVNSFNETVTTYTDVATVWAAVEWRSGRRFEEAAKLNAEIQGVIRIRYRTDIRPEWRLKYGNRDIQILSVTNPYERGQELQLNCKELTE